MAHATFQDGCGAIMAVVMVDLLHKDPSGDNATITHLVDKRSISEEILV